MPGGERSPCGACKFLRRKCIEGCVFAPYFSTVEFGAAHFASIHKIFGASNFSKLLQKIPLERERYDAVVSISYEAEARLQDPVYGCVSHIFALQRQVAYLQAELNFVRARLGNSSVRTSLTPHYVNGNLSEILTTSSIQSPSEPLTCYQCVYESNSKRSCFLMEDNCNSFEASPAHGGDLHDLAFALLKRSRG